MKLCHSRAQAETDVQTIKVLLNAECVKPMLNMVLAQIWSAALNMAFVAIRLVPRTNYLSHKWRYSTAVNFKNKTEKILVRRELLLN